VYLEQINVGYNVTVDSAQTDKDGKFTFKTYVELPTFFNVKVGESGPVTFIASADENIQISGTLEGLEQNYWVDGSENSLWIKLLNFQLNNTLTAMDSLQETFKAIPEDQAAKRAEVAHAWDSVVNKQINFSKEFILKHAVSPASYYALYQKFNDNSFILDPIEDLHSYKIVASSLKAMYPESQYTKAILQHLDQISNSIQNERIRRIIDNADSNLPAISLPNASGDTIALSDLRGKYIILDFNVLGAKESEGYTQELKKVYNKFRNRGVEIYQVCLDNNQLLWSRLVKQYGITWQCVRDPQGLQSRVAQTWNVQTVPANYIINPKFEIVGKNLTGARLEERLNDLMKQR
jgi:peroxiredoxin